jgi:hypothetical protein
MTLHTLGQTIEEVRRSIDEMVRERDAVIVQYNKVNAQVKACQQYLREMDPKAYWDSFASSFKK